MNIFSKNCFSQNLFIKKWLIIILGKISYRRFNGINRLKIKGISNLKNLPQKNVLFVSNHQTYFADATAMFHVFNAALNGLNNINNTSYLYNPKLNLYYIAAKETMKSGILPKILAYTGSISIQRTWRSKGKSVNRNLKISDVENVKKALNDGWVITFPQGTTDPWKPVRKGTAHLIKQHRPIVVPIVIGGFRKAFGKKGLSVKSKNNSLTMTVKQPLHIDFKADKIENVVDKIALSIEQHHSQKNI